VLRLSDLAPNRALFMGNSVRGLVAARVIGASEGAAAEPSSNGERAG